MDLKKSFEEINQDAIYMIHNSDNKSVVEDYKLRIMGKLYAVQKYFYKRNISSENKISEVEFNDVFMDTIIEVLEEKDGHFRFDPDKSSFMTYFQRILFYRKKDGFRDTEEEQMKVSNKNFFRGSDEKISVKSIESMVLDDSDGNTYEKYLEQLTIDNVYPIEQGNVQSIIVIIGESLKRENPTSKETDNFEKIKRRLVFDIIKNIKKFDKILDIKNPEKDKDILDMRLKELKNLDKMLIPDEMDFFFEIITRTCYEIYYHDLRKNIELTYKFLNQYLNQYLESVGKKTMQLDNMKKWYAEHYDNIWKDDIRKKMKNMECV